MIYIWVWLSMWFLYLNYGLKYESESTNLWGNPTAASINKWRSQPLDCGWSSQAVAFSQIMTVWVRVTIFHIAAISVGAAERLHFLVDFWLLQMRREQQVQHLLAGRINRIFSDFPTFRSSIASSNCHLLNFSPAMCEVLILFPAVTRSASVRGNVPLTCLSCWVDLDVFRFCLFL